MKVTFFLIGKTEESYLKAGIDNYLERLKHYINIDWVLLPAVKGGSSISKETCKLKEGEIFLSRLKNTDTVILLDERGSQLTSTELAGYLEKQMVAGTKSLVFIVGGAFGVSEKVKERADFTWSLSRLTFSHQMVRLLLVEQVYRAMTIIKGEKYHHD